MNKETVRIRYDGPALAEHTIDVNHLAPALLSLGDLCTLANRRFNEDRASVKVMVQTDQESQCFEFGIEIIQTIWSQAKSLIGNQDVKTAKEIAEIIGLISGATLGVAGISYGFLKFATFAKGRKIEDTTVRKTVGRDVVEVKVEGDNNIVTVIPESLEMYQDPDALRHMQQLVKPLSETGYESIAFEHGDDPPERIKKDDALDVLEVDVDALDADEIVEKAPVQEMQAFLKVYSPIYDMTKPKWKFDIGDGRIASVDISETDIAAEAMKRGAAFIDDVYVVKLEVAQGLTRKNKIRTWYKVKDVIQLTQCLKGRIAMGSTNRDKDRELRIMENKATKSTETDASVFEFHRRMYERRIKRMKRRSGLTEKEIVDQANDPAFFHRNGQASRRS